MAVQEMQKNLLANVQKTFAERRNSRILTRHFNAYLELYH